MIDTTFDFRTDARGKDPDSHSPTLRLYHQELWSKPLPNGHVFDLVTTTPGVYLHHRSEIGEFWLSSDAVMATFSRRDSMQPIITQFDPAVIDEFNTVGYTMGGMMLFPGQRVDGKITINGARGFNGKIADRMDLTLECIRRHYRDQASPLGDTLQRYADFFELFEDFDGYTEFFLLQDLVDSKGQVRFFMPFDDFNPPAIPKDVATYDAFRLRSIEFIEARNRRIDAYAAAQLNA